MKNKESTKILNHTMSNKAELIFEDIINNLKKEVVFKDLSTIDITSYGAADYTGEEYVVYLNTKLHSDVFEVNLFHELLHLQQIDEGYPVTVYREVNKNEAEYFAEFGRRLQACILDLDVDTRLNKLGYSSEYFIKKRYKAAKSTNFVSINDVDTTNHMIVQLIMLLYQLKDDQRIYLLSLIKKQNEKLYFQTFEAYNLIKDIKFINSDNCFLAFSIIINYLQLFNDHHILYQSTFFTSHAHVLAYLNNHK